MEEETRYRLLKYLESNPEASQREIARELSVSLGKANYCLRALMDKGWVKMDNFRRNPNKRSYTYLLTPHGLDEKARLTLRFLRRKMREYETLQQEIAELQEEVENLRTQQAIGLNEK